MKNLKLILPVILAALILSIFIPSYAIEYDGYVDEVFFSDFNGGELSSDLEYKTGVDDLPTVVNKRVRMKINSDRRLMTKYALVTSNSNELLTGEAFDELRRVKFCTDIEFDALASIDFCSNVHGYNGAGELKRLTENWIKFMTDGTMKLADGSVIKDENEDAITYETGENYSFAVYADFDTETYDVYRDGVLLAENVDMAQNGEYALSWRINVNAAADGYIYIDNLGYFKETEAAFMTDKFSVEEEGFPIIGKKIEFPFNTYIADSKEDIEQMISLSPAAEYDVSVNKNVVSLEFTAPLEFEEDYTLIFNGTLTDWRGESILMDKSVSFTTMREQLIVAVPEISGTQGNAQVSAELTNPLSTPHNIGLMIIQYDSDGKMLEKAITPFVINEAPSGGINTQTISGIADRNDAARIIAYITDEDGKTLSDGFASYDFTTLSNGEYIRSDVVSATLSENIITDEYIVADGSLDGEGIRMVEISFLYNGKEIFFTPVLTDAEGNFTYQLAHNDSEGIYTVKVSGKTLSESATLTEYSVPENNCDMQGNGEEYDGYLEKVLFADFDSGSIPTNIEYKSGDVVIPPEVIDNRVRLSTMGTNNNQTDHYFRSQYTLINSDYQNSLLSASALKKVQRVKFSADIELSEFAAAHLMSNADTAVVATRKTEYYVSFKSDGTMVLADGTSFPYETNREYSFDIYADFENGRYTIYRDGVLLKKNVAMKQSGIYALSFGVTLEKQAVDGYVYVDNLGYFTQSNAEYLADMKDIDAEAFPVVGGRIELPFSSIVMGDAQALVEIDNGAIYTVSTEKNNVVVTFDAPLDFNTEYTLTLSGEISDWRAQTINVSDTVKFKTLTKQLVASVPLVSGTVANTDIGADVINPFEEEKTVYMTVIKYDASGNMLSKEAEPFTLAVTAEKQTITLSDVDCSGADTVIAYVTDSNGKTLSDGFASYDFETLSNDAHIYADTVSASFTDAVISGEDVVAKGKLNSSGVRMIEISFLRDGGEIFFVPVLTDAQGNFSYSIKHGDADGNYTVAVFGKTLSNTVQKSEYYLSASGKETVKTAINSAGANLKNYMMTEGAQKLNIESTLVTDSLVAVLTEQLPIENTDKVKTILQHGATVENLIQNESWDKFDGAYGDYSYIMFVSATDKSAYASYLSLAPETKSLFNNALVGKDISTLSKFRTEFALLIPSYTTQTPPSGDGGSGGSGGARPTTNTPSVDVSIGGAILPEAQQKTSFPDLDRNSWVYESAEYLKAKGILSGDDKGKLNPENNITRAEFLKLLVTALNITAGSECTFADVNKNDWFYVYASAAQNSGIINGDESGKFNGNSQITRQDMAVMIYRAKNDIKDKGIAFNASDSSEISQYAREAVSALCSAGIINGMGNGSFAPKMNATRAQAIKMIYTMLVSGGEL